MKIEKYCCDHCGKVLDTMKDLILLEISLEIDDFKTDLCVECYEKLQKQTKEFYGK